jgi:hypothetical protein
VIDDDELAAIAAALATLTTINDEPAPDAGATVSRWKRAARSFDPEVNDVRAVF